jgi:hypothetical protein
MKITAMLKRLGTLLKWGMLTIATLIIFLFAINSNDENPSAELRQLLQLPKFEADSNNGFPALVGSIQAPADEDISTYGARWISAYSAATSSNLLDLANEDFKKTGPKFIGHEQLLCNPSKNSCLAIAQERSNEWRKLAKDNQFLIKRQHDLSNFSYFKDNYFPANIASPFPQFGHTVRILVLDMIALDAIEGRLDQALASLEARILMDRRILFGSQSLLLSMSARVWLMQDYALLADIVARYSSSLATQKERLSRMTEPLSIEEIRVVASKMYEGESRLIVHSLPNALNDSSSWTDLIVKPFFRRIATMNLSVAYHQILQSRINQFSPENADELIMQWQKDVQNWTETSIVSWHLLYNPVGKILVAISSPGSEHEYLLRLTDLIGISRLARLQVNAVMGKHTDTSRLLKENTALYNPYTNKAMDWDDKNRQLYFDIKGATPRDTGRHIVVTF